MWPSVVPIMRRQKFGRIINIASEAGKNGGTIYSMEGKAFLTKLFQDYAVVSDSLVIRSSSRAKPARLLNTLVENRDLCKFVND